MMRFMDTVFGRSYVRSSRGTLLQRVHAALALRRSRARLAALEPHLLLDIGIAPEEAQAEATRTVWDAPVSWKH